MRAIVAERGGIALAESAEDDDLQIRSGNDGAFDVDPDPRPMPYRPPAGHFAVIDAASGELLGDVGWIPVVHGPTVGCLAWNVGITLLPGARGRGVGSIAQRLLAEHLFATTDKDRVEASTDVENLAEQKALERAGFQREGVLRSAQVRGGIRRDIVLYSLLRAEL